MSLLLLGKVERKKVETQQQRSGGVQNSAQPGAGKPPGCVWIKIRSLWGKQEVRVPAPGLCSEKGLRATGFGKPAWGEGAEDWGRAGC